MTRALVVVLLLIACAAAQAQPTPYAARERGAAFSYLELSLDGEGVVTGRLLGNPGRHGGRAYAFEGAATRDGARLRLETRARPPRGGPARALSLEAALTEAEGNLDPYGTARVRWGDEPGGGPPTLRFDAIGTSLHASAELADGSLQLTRTAPSFYAEPWRALSFAWNEADLLGTNLQRGLEQRQDAGESAVGAWFDHRRTRVRSLSRVVVSVLQRQRTYTGGAHPNTTLAAETYVSDGAAWRPAPACEAARALRWPCDTDVLRARVIEGLRAQDAAWVGEGQVDADTPWLLDTFTVEPGGIAAHFSPYAVGPYAQGTFEVRVPFERLRP